MDQRPVRILLIDDDEDDYLLTRDLLTEIPNLDFELDWVSTYEAGLEALCQSKHDVFLVDYRLGQHTGLDLLRQAAHRSYSGPVILLTGQGEREVDMAAMEAGASDYLEKSRLDAAILDRAIRYALLEKCHAAELERKVSERTEELARTNAVLQAEVAARKRACEALCESEARFRHLANAMPQFVWIIARDGTLEYINRRWTQYTGLSMEETCDRSLVKKLIHPDDVASITARAEEALATGASYQVEFRLQRASDGVYRWFLARGVPVRNEKDEVVRWYGTSTDIDDQKRAEQLLRESDRRKDEFLATLAHELRNPLPPIRNALEIMRLAGNNPEAGERCRAMIERQVRQLVRLIEDLMDISRITRGKVELRKEVVDLAAVVHSAVETSQPLIDSLAHSLTVELPAEPVKLDADPLRLAQVLVNLLNNAAKYTDHAGQIWLTAQRQGRQVVLRVRDTGIGISRELQADVFEKFAQVGRSGDRSQGGLGIGLFLVRALVKLHGGTVEVHSEGPGKGSEFVVSLPLRTDL